MTKKPSTVSQELWELWRESGEYAELERRIKDECKELEREHTLAELRALDEFECQEKRARDISEFSARLKTVGWEAESQPVKSGKVIMTLKLTAPDGSRYVIYPLDKDSLQFWRLPDEN